nr:hypothetical protein [Rhodococcus sp. BH5]
MRGHLPLDLGSESICSTALGAVRVVDAPKGAAKDVGSEVAFVE